VLVLYLYRVTEKTQSYTEFLYFYIMDIVIIGTAFPYRGGLAAYNERLARQFLAEGHKVTILTFTVQYPGFLFPGKSQYLEGPPPQGLEIRRVLNSVNPFNWFFVGWMLRKSKPDLLIIKYWLPFMAPCFGTVSRLARSNRLTRTICIFDNVIPHEKRPGDRLLTSFFTRAIDAAVAMSESVLSDLRQFRTDIPAALNPHPLFDNFGATLSKDVARKKLGLGDPAGVILFFGFIRAYKGLDLLIEAFGAEDMRKLKLRLVIAGEFYEDSSRYMELVRKYKLQDEIIFFDRFINDNEVKDFFSAADLVVQPYKDATQSGVTQICYHFEKPMVVTDVGGLKEIVPDGSCGYVVKPQSDEICNAIKDFFISDRKEFFIENIRHEKTRFGWDRMTGKVLDLFKNIPLNDNKK
jgi:glycosyltransferase involved in cell wall biosynthesis